MHLRPDRPTFAPVKLEEFSFGDVDSALKRRVALYGLASFMLIGTWFWGSHNMSIVERANADELNREAQALSVARAEAVASWEFPVTEFVRKGVKLDEGNKRELAVQVLEAAARQNPTVRDAQLQLAYVYLEDGRLTDAEPVLQRAHELDPVYPRTYELMGYLYQQQGKRDAATAALAKAKRFEKIPNL